MKSWLRSFTLITLLIMAFGATYVMPQTNLLPNGDLEIQQPNFWTKLNEGAGGSTLTWDLANGHNSSRSLKIAKPSASDNVVGWKSANNANLYWNGAKANLTYTLNFWAKTQGVNTNPASLDDRIGYIFLFRNNIKQNQKLINEIQIKNLTQGGVYVSLDNIEVEEIHQSVPESEHKPGEWAATYRIEYSGFPMKEPDKVVYKCKGTGCNPNGETLFPGDYSNYEYVDSYHGKVWVGSDGLCHETYTIEFQIVLNGLRSNKITILVRYPEEH